MIKPFLTDGTVTNFDCPMCKAKLKQVTGHRLVPTVGVTLYCDNEACPAQEVMGYGASPAAAFKIVTDRFSFARKEE